MSIRRPVPWAIVAAVALVTGVVMIAGRNGTVRNPAGAVVESDGAAFDAIRADEIKTILTQDAIPALIKPTYLAASQASDMYDREMVIGVVINGDARAYPLATMSVHEIADDDIGGQPVALTW